MPTSLGFGGSELVCLDVSDGCLNWGGYGSFWPFWGLLNPVCGAPVGLFLFFMGLLRCKIFRRHAHSREEWFGSVAFIFWGLLCVIVLVEVGWLGVFFGF